MSKSRTLKVNFDEILRSSSQVLESYDVQEFISYLSHSTWQVLTDKEYYNFERKRTKDQKWFYLRDLLKWNPDRIERFILVSQQFAANVHAEVSCALSSLSKSIHSCKMRNFKDCTQVQDDTTMSYSSKEMIDNGTDYPDEELPSLNSSESNIFQTDSQDSYNGIPCEPWTSSGVEISTGTSMHMMELEHSQSESVEMSQVSPEEQAEARVGQGTDHELTEVENIDAGYETFQSASTSASADQSLDIPLAPLPSFKHPRRPRPIVPKQSRHVATKHLDYGHQQGMPSHRYYTSPWQPYPHPPVTHQPTVHNHFYFNSSDMTRPSLPQCHTIANEGRQITANNLDPSTSSDSDEELERLSQIKKRILEKYTDRLIKSMNVPTLVPHLQRQRLISSRDLDILQNKDIPDEDKNMYILKELPSKGRDFFERFVKCLKDASDHSGHEDLAKLLERKCAKRLHSTCIT